MRPGSARGLVSGQAPRGGLHFLYKKVTEETVRFPLCSSKIQSSYHQVLLPAKLEIVAASLCKKKHLSSRLTETNIHFPITWLNIMRNLWRFLSFFCLFSFFFYPSFEWQQYSVCGRHTIKVKLQPSVFIRCLLYHLKFNIFYSGMLSNMLVVSWIWSNISEW